VAQLGFYIPRAGRGGIAVSLAIDTDNVTHVLLADGWPKLGHDLTLAGIAGALTCWFEVRES
jgi:hypothetical protein